MKKKISLLLFGAILTTTLYVPCAYAESGELKQIYVSPTATGGSGTKEAPFGNLETAMRSAAAMAKTMSSGRVEIILEKGTHRLEKSLEITNDICGNEKVELAFVGQDGAKVTTAKRLPNDKFTRVSDAKILEKIPKEGKSSVYQINLKELGISKYGHPDKENNYSTFDVYMDSQIMTNAKWPNDDKTKVIDSCGKSPAGEMIFSDAMQKKYSFVTDAPKERLEKWKNAEDARIFGNLAAGWTTYWYDLVGVIPEKNAITIHGDLLFDKVTKGFPWFIENLIEELDAPGEYYLDRKTGILYLIPLGNINSAEIEYSTTDGANSDGSSNMTIFNIGNSKNLSFENLDVSDSVSRAFYLASGSVKIKNCKVKNVYSGFTSWDANNCEITGCEFSYTKIHGVLIMGGNRQTLTSSNSIVSNNYFHTNNIGSHLGAPVILNGCGMTLSNNLIADQPHWGVQYGGNDHIIEKNEIYGCLTETADAGVFYCGRDLSFYGNVLEKNYIHDIRRFDGEPGVMVFYQDDQASGITVKNNIIQRSVGGILNGGGRNNTLTGNIIMDGFENSSMSIFCDARGYGALGEAMRTDFWNSSQGKALATIPYESEVWLEKYPQVKETVEADEPHAPYNTIVTNNIISNYMRENTGDIAPQVRALGTIENNYYIPEQLSYDYDERGIIEFTNKAEFERFGCDWIDTSDIGVLGGGNYTIPSDRKLYEEYVVDLASMDVSGEHVSYPEKQIEIVDLLSDPQKLDGADLVEKSGSNVILKPGGNLGYKGEKFDSFVLRGKFKTTEDFSCMPIYFKAANTTGDCWVDNFSYSVWIKSDYIELQKWNPGNTVFDAAPSTVKRDGSWNTIEIVCNKLSNGGIDLYFNLNGKTVFMSTDFDSNKLTEPGYITFMTSGTPVEFGKYEKTLNEKNEQYTDKNNSLDNVTHLNEAEEKTEPAVTQLPVKVTIDDKELKNDAKPYIRNSRTYVPLRAIFEKLGARVDWLDSERAAVAFFGTNRMYIGEGQNHAVLNGEKINTDTPPEIKDNSIMIGARFVAEMFGCEVKWISDTRTVEIITPQYAEEKKAKEEEEKNTEKEDEKTASKYNDRKDVQLYHKSLPIVYFDMNEPIKDGILDVDKIDVSGIDERAYEIRTKLLNNNFRISNQPDRVLNVAFVGADIESESREYICTWLKNCFGDRFNFVNNQRTNTNVEVTADRIYKDAGVIDPDLVFVTLDDKEGEAEDIARNTESILRQLYDINDTTEIVFVYADSNGDGTWNNAVKAEDYVARYYGIPEVFLAASDTEFTNIDKFLSDMFVNDVPGWNANDYLQVMYLFKDSAGTRKVADTQNYTENNEVTLSFKGTQAGVFVTSGTIDIYVDGEFEKTVKARADGGAVKTDVLENAEHTVIFKKSEKAEDTQEPTYDSGFVVGIIK